jgi:NitT/TauT family transport system substrate-binding protein
MRRYLTVLVAVALALFALSACGGDDGGGDEAAGGGTSASAGPTTVKVGVLPLGAVAPLYLGKEKGFFEEENLQVEPQIAQGGAAIVPAVASGEYEFGYSNNVSLLIASTKGLPLRIVTEGNQEAETVEGATDAIVVKENSDIRRPEDLAGKTIGVNTLQNIGDVAIKTALENRGVEVSNIKLVEVPFPEMVAAVDAGRIDAGWVVEPFVQQAKAQDMRVIVHPFFETAPRLSLGTYFTSERYANENPEVVERFERAMNRSLEYAQEHPDEVRQISTEFTEIPPAVAEKMALPYFSSEINVESLELTAEQMEKYGLTEEKPDVSKLLPDDAQR